MGLLRRRALSKSAPEAAHSRRAVLPAWAGAALRYIALCVVTAFCLLPLLWAISSSLKPLDQVYRIPPTFWVSDPVWSNYTEALTRLPVVRFCANSLLISVASVIGAVLTASMAGFALAKLPVRFRTTLFWLLLLSMIIPAQLLLVPRFLIFESLGWVDTYKPLIVPAWLGGGAFNVLLFRQFFRAIPRDYVDAATIDGASPWQTYWHVCMPMARPAVVTAALLSFVYHWQEFLDPLIYLNDFKSFTISLGLRMYQSTAGTWGNLLMAASLIALVPVAIMFVICQRSLMQGLGVAVTRQDL